ncbi:MAG: hypothetical protein WCS70_02305 [Verrucomicrobiota bacterium]
MGAPPQDKLHYRGKLVVRTLGTIFITVCVAMIVLGETLLKDDLHGPQFVLYWTWCFLITILAGITAVVDLIFVRRAGKESRRELLRREFTGRG